jgi:hypothetical protein
LRITLDNIYFIPVTTTLFSAHGVAVDLLSFIVIYTKGCNKISVSLAWFTSEQFHNEFVDFPNIFHDLGTSRHTLNALKVECMLTEHSFFFTLII